MAPPGFRPAMFRPPFDFEKRIGEIQAIIDDEKTPEGQRKNLEFLIKLYKERKIDGYEIVYIQDQKIIQRKELHGNSPWWNEVSYLLMLDRLV